MSIERHLAKQGIELNVDNSLPVGERTQKHFKRVIAAVRAAEADANDELQQANNRCRQAQSQVIELQERLRMLENEVRKYRVREKLEGLEKLTVSDRQQLLEVS